MGLDVQSYINKWLPHTMKVAQQTGFFTSVLLAQQIWETGIDTNSNDRTILNNNNLGGIKAVSSGRSFWIGKDSGGHAVYRTLDSFAGDYARVLSLSYYNNPRKADTPEEQAIILSQEKTYATAGYGTDNKGLIYLINKYNLKQYDTMTVADIYDNDFEQKVDGMSDEELKKYATLGLGMVMMLGIAKGLLD